MNDSVKSFFIFFRLFWYLSIVFLLLFILFDCKRLYDFVTNDYQLEKMFVETCKWGGHSQAKKDLTIFGNINTNEKVCIYLYRDNIEGSLCEEGKLIDVIKFKHSSEVLRADNNAFQNWKMTLFSFIWYVVISTIIIFLKRKYKISIINILDKYYKQ